MALLGCKENAKKVFEHTEFNRHLVQVTFHRQGPDHRAVPFFYYYYYCYYYDLHGQITQPQFVPCYLRSHLAIICFRPEDMCCIRWVMLIISQAADDCAHFSIFTEYVRVFFSSISDLHWCNQFVSSHPLPCIIIILPWPDILWHCMVYD